MACVDHPCSCSLKHLANLNVGCCACHILQKLCKPLRQLQRLLTAPGSDPVLAGLSTHAVHAAELRLTQALTVTALAHHDLRAAIDVSIARDTWGVIQRGFDVAHELAQRTRNEVGNCCLSALQVVKRLSV
jgi:hypothetical protein